MGGRLRFENLDRINLSASDYWVDENACRQYWDSRAEFSIRYGRETYYTITPIPYYNRRRDFQMKNLSPWLSGRSGKLLDYGGGDGRLAILIKKRFPDLEVVTCDISHKMVHRSQKNIQSEGLNNIRSMVIEDHFFNTFKEREFDFCLVSMVFAHVNEETLGNTLKKLYQLIAPGGLFFLFEHVGRSREWAMGKVRPMKEYLADLQENGFEVLEYSLFSTPFYWKWRRKVNFFSSLCAKFAKAVFGRSAERKAYYLLNHFIDYPLIWLSFYFDRKNPGEDGYCLFVVRKTAH